MLAMISYTMSYDGIVVFYDILYDITDKYFMFLTIFAL